MLQAFFRLFELQDKNFPIRELYLQELELAAAEAGERIDNPKSGFYRDEVHVYGTELRKRGARLGLPDVWLREYLTSDRPSRVLRDWRRHCANDPDRAPDCGACAGSLNGTLDQSGRCRACGHSAFGE